ncbi:peroxiredoxin [Collibacillus ludicampi]|uniref:thioredoxin-dependent peroxiredoxin n=1 Tax=Collibacillus ludicampi TaxID=2771369 RepID=A0AAV4LAF0_9BACL|nr:thioredoxin-dependent thiol peroxidase [Collibacillus ludicampi]GIM44819.1 peroxiredoxin [Collibacillus ludicampi]
MENIQEGMSASDFTLPASNGEDVTLSSFRGKHVVLYFYPKDDTPGCTTEACGFRDLHDDFASADAVILGVSPDPVNKHVKFIEKYGLPFLLLADTEHRVAELYGVWKEKKNYGRTYMGIERTTFVIDKTGVIRKIYPKVKVNGHMEEVLAFVKTL